MSSSDSSFKANWVVALMSFAEQRAVESIQAQVGNIGALIADHMQEGHSSPSVVRHARDWNSASPAAPTPQRGRGTPRVVSRGGGAGRRCGFSIVSASPSSQDSTISTQSEASRCTALQKLATTCLNELRQSGTWLTKDLMASTRLGTLQDLIARLNLPRASSMIMIQPARALCVYNAVRSSSIIWIRKSRSSNRGLRICSWEYV